MDQALTEQVHAVLRRSIISGDIAIDATAGNGHDTLLLAELVGVEGRVFAFDNQLAAINSAKQRLQHAGLDARVTWLCHNHATMRHYIPASLCGGIASAIFNLGYLPGGDKSRITTSDSTLSALQQALLLLRSGGVISIIAYTGHPGGRQEAEIVKDWVSNLRGVRFKLTIPVSKTGTAPEWLLVYKN